MCGVVGWLASNQQHEQWLENKQAFIHIQKHRGPDSFGSFVDNGQGLFLGHNRLSIIELSNLGHQPMQCSEGNVLSFNGEIYNYKELRHELTQLGLSFKSHSDTEVLLLALQHWGIEHTLDRVVGMFAFAFWHKASSTLHLARDPMGIKPLYYWTKPNTQSVAFCSELFSLRALPDFSVRLNGSTLKQVLEFGHSIDERATAFEGVQKVAPGQRLVLQNGKIVHKESYYQPECRVFEPNDHQVSSVEEQLYHTLQTVVDQHFVADVPVGMLLSGGLDSSLIAALASKHRQIHTVSMGFADSKIDERQFARQVAEHIGSQHSEFYLQPDDILNSINDAARHYDDIFCDWGLVTTRLLYKYCQSKDIKVVLVGEGADELFGGYSTYRFTLQNSPSELNIFRLYRQFAGKRYGSQYPAFRKLFKQYLKQCDSNFFAALRLFETRNRLPNNYVQKVDKASMSVSVEARTPFLDRRIANIAYQLPPELLVNENDEKLILKSIARKHTLLPEEVLKRKKFGAGIANDWMIHSDTMRQFSRDIILDQSGLSHQLGFDKPMRLFFDHGKKGYRAPYSISIFSNLAWRLLVLNLWAQQLNSDHSV